MRFDTSLFATKMCSSSALFDLGRNRAATTKHQTLERERERDKRERGGEAMKILHVLGGYEK
jgi:hypothetical protein